MYKRIILLVFWAGFAVTNATAQEKEHYLSLGEILPASTWKIIPKKENTKLVILDFWSSGCSNCIDAFPKMESLQKEFGDSLQIVLVNSWETDSEIKESFRKININRAKGAKEPRTMPALTAINGDTALIKYFPVSRVPHHVWLDNNGKLLYITHGHNATSEHIHKVLAGDSIKMLIKNDIRNKNYDGLFMTGDPAVSTTFYSGFAGYCPGLPGSSGFQKDPIAGTTRRTYTNRAITDLYQIAFNVNNKELRMLLEVKDKAYYSWPDWLKEGDKMDDWLGKNIFSYEICVPVNEEKNISKYMQADLNRFFGIEQGIEGLIEKRKLECLILISRKRDLLKTSSVESQYESNDTLMQLFNYPFVSVLDFLKNSLEDMSLPLAFVDETGIDPNLKVDITLTGDLKNKENIRKQLQRYGLDIIERKREIEVLVISEKK